MRKFIVIFIFILIIPFRSYGSNDIIRLTDSSRISLLTITPSNEQVYTLFGHTAIRIKDDSVKIDVVFNYGLFDFNTPNFIYRFVKGETDYMVGAVPFDYFIIEYQTRGVGIYEQVFDISAKDKQHIWEALLDNTKPENRVYRYNFLYDNCATRPRDIIESNIEGEIIYTPTMKEQTYRNLIHECTFLDRWTQFGIDIIIGSGADKIITDRQKDFLPRYLCEAYTLALLNTDSAEDKYLISDSHFIIKPTTEENIKYFQKNYPDLLTARFYTPVNYPLIIGCILLVLTFLIFYLSYKKNKIILGKIFDTILFLVAGLTGYVIFFLWFVSEHPCVDANWNLVWLNPLQLLMACLFFVKPLQKYIYYYHFINFAVLLLFLLAWCLIPQQLEIAFAPYILCLVARSGSNILQYKKYRRAHKEFTR